MFGDANGYFKKINHGPNKVDSEIINTIKIINAHYILKSKIQNGRPANEEDNNGNVLGLQKL